MAYTNAIFFLDYVNGNDAARTTLSNVVFTNPSADLVLGTYIGHGLLTGAVITVSGCTQAYANSTWKITFVSANTFTLDNASWASFTGVDIIGDAVPFGGQSWTDAWKTITTGATAARIAPGDIIKIAKSPVPTILGGATGHATWTNLSKTVTLADAQTATIDLCEADWTAVNATSSAKLAVATDAKEGSYCLKMIEDGTPVNDEVQCYSDLYTHDTTVHNLSGYQKISFWIKNEVAILANQLEINLCSNADGTGDVDTFAIPAIPSTGRWVPLTIARTGGGNLGNAIKSISIANGSNTTEYTASKYIYLDNIIACTTAGLNLQSLISKNTLEQGGAEGWYGIQSINGTTVLLDNDTNTKANAGKGYSTTGTSPDTVDTYIRETTKYDLGASHPMATINDSGSATGGYIEFKGGYDITDATGETQNGETFIDDLASQRIGFFYGGTQSYIKLDHISAVRMHTFCYWDSTSHDHITIDNVQTIVGCSQQGLYATSAKNITIGTIKNIINNANGTSWGGRMTIVNEIGNISNNTTSGFVTTTLKELLVKKVGNVLNNGTYGISIINAGTVKISDGIVKSNGYGINISTSDDVYLNNVDTESNTTAGIYSSGRTNNIKMKDCSIAETPEVSFLNTMDYYNDYIYSQNHDNSGYEKIFVEYGLIESQSATAGGSGKEWKMSVTDVKRTTEYPLVLPVAKIAVASSGTVTVKLYFKKSNGADIGARLVCRVGQVAWSDGTADKYTTAPSDTSRNEVTLTFTPTEAGVVEIEVWAYWAANLADESVYIDDMTITQAD